jgi:PAS domain-containing protein
MEHPRLCALGVIETVGVVAVISIMPVIKPTEVSLYENEKVADAFICKSEGPEVLLNRISTLLAAQDREPLRDSERLTRLSWERLAAILASVMDAVIVVDEKQRIVLFNKAAEYLPLPQRAGTRHVHRSVHPGALPRTALGACPRVRQDRNCNHHVARRARWASDRRRGVPRRSDDLARGRRGVLRAGAARHHKERRQAEEKQAQLAAIVESSNDAIIGKTLEGIMTTWNKAAERMYGYRAEEIVGKSASILLPPRQNPRSGTHPQPDQAGRDGAAARQCPAWRRTAGC